MTTELVVTLSNHVSLDSLTSKIAQILQAYRTVRLEVEGRQIRVEHVGNRDGVIDNLESLVDSLSMEAEPWADTLLNTMLNTSRRFNGYVIRALFVRDKTSVFELLKLKVGEELGHVLGSEIIEDSSLLEYQLVLGLAPTYSATIGQLRTIVLVELPYEEDEEEEEETDVDN
jgi:hypothetical protein